MWKAESKYVRIEPDGTVVLKFNPEKIRHVEGQFGARIQYTVIDPNYSEKGEKRFEAGKLIKTNRFTFASRKVIAQNHKTRRRKGNELQCRVS